MRLSIPLTLVAVRIPTHREHPFQSIVNGDSKRS